MKKALLVVVVLCIFAVPVLFAQVGNLGAFNSTLRVESRNHITDITTANMLGGHRITAGESYTLTVRFRLSRDLEDKMQFIFVDRTEGANWWTELTVNDEGSQIPMPLRANTEYSATLRFRATASASSGNRNANALVIITDGVGSRAITINWLEFVLTRN